MVHKSWKSPEIIIVYGKKFVLGGCMQCINYTRKSCGHFTAVIYWNNKPYYYDGLQKSKEQRFVTFDKRYMKDKNGGFAYYFVSS